MIEAKNVCKAYGTLKAVDNVSFSVSRGECLAILGSNGAGKSTLCEMMVGLKNYDSGSIRLNGYDPKSQKDKIKPIIGALLQENILYKKYTIQETFELFASFYPQIANRTQRISATLEKIQLREKKDTRLEALSGGQRQRVYIGVCLLHDPDILFLDEPTTGLDPEVRKEVWKLIAALKERGKSIILTTHYMEEANFLADRVAILRQGKIQAIDSVANLSNQLGREKIIEVEASGNWQNAAKDLKLQIISQSDNSHTITFESFESLQHFLAAASKEKVNVYSINTRKPDLEDIYNHFIQAGSGGQQSSQRSEGSSQKGSSL